MDYEQSALDFLSTEENLPIALEIAELLERLKTKLHLEFWAAFREALGDRLALSEYSAEWEIQATSREGLLKEGASCFVVRSGTAPNERRFRIGIEQGKPTSEFPLYYGIKLPESDPHSVQIARLADALRAEGYSRDMLWVGWKPFEFPLESKGFLVRWVADSDIFIDGLVEKVWTVFESKYVLIEAALRSLDA